MFYMAKILKCDDCGSIIQVLAEGDEKVCSDHMLAFPVQTEGEKSPKHKPVVEIDGDKDAMYHGADVQDVGQPGRHHLADLPQGNGNRLQYSWLEIHIDCFI